MNANWGLVPELPRRKGEAKRERREEMYRRGLAAFEAWLAATLPEPRREAALPA